MRASGAAGALGGCQACRASVIDRTNAANAIDGIAACHSTRTPSERERPQEPNTIGCWAEFGTHGFLRERTSARRVESPDGGQPLRRPNVDPVGNWNTGSVIVTALRSRAGGNNAVLRHVARTRVRALVTTA